MSRDGPPGVDVWTVAVDGDDRSAALLECLSTAERGRAAELSGFARRRWIAGRATLRMLLSEVTGVPACRMEFAREPGGRPVLSWPPARLSFSMSHSGRLVACAVGLRGAVGVDVEHVRPLGRMATVHAFSRSEALAVLRQPEGRLRDAAFLGCWTRKEAVLKATGLGLRIPLDAFAVTVPPEPAAIVCPPPVCGSANWVLDDLALGDGFVGAVACTAGPCELRVRDMDTGRGT